MKNWTPSAKDTARADLAHHVGYDLLGPVVQRWLLALHQHLLFHGDGSTVTLYCARAGVRIRELYDLFSGGRHGMAPSARMLWGSRLAIAKGVYGRPGGQARTVGLLMREYRHQPLRDLVKAVMRHCPDRLDGLDLRDRSLDAHGHNLAGWLTVDGTVQRRLHGYLADSGEAFERMMTDLLGGAERALLIDSGWQGTAQSLLTAAFPETAWRGLYFGRILTETHDPRITADCIGLMFEDDRWVPGRPETAFTRHRHLIETLLEPAAPSVEDVRGGPAAAATEAMIAACRTAVPDPETDRLYIEVRRYVSDHAGQSPSRIVAAHQAAMRELARMLLRPAAEDVPLLAPKARSADFGKALVVPVVVDPQSSPDTTREDRIAGALWTEGQIALEHPPGVAHDLQAKVNGCTDASEFHDPAGRRPDLRPPKTATASPRVAVITRTRNRPVLLRRAAASVAGQTFRDLVWCVVNDGGAVDDVKDIMRRTPMDPRRQRLVNHDRSCGMEAASNAGIAASRSEYIVIHDDDDSWHPEFLERTIGFLESEAGARYGGVATHSVYVSEEVRDDTVIEHEERPYNDWVRNVQLSEMACGNFFPPIAFVFRRRVWDRVGGFNEALPVLGDWFFNMEVLLEDDIAVLPEPLARYHHRDRGHASGSSYANSVIGGISKHEEFAAVARNAFLRRHGERAGIAASFALGYAVNDLRGRIGRQGADAAMPQAAPPPAGRTGTDDRLWCAAELGAALGRRSLLWRALRNRPVAADIPWDDLTRRMRAARLTLRAPPDFDDAAYLQCNPDVDAAVQGGAIATAYMHYVLHGRAEGRPRKTRAA